MTVVYYKYELVEMVGERQGLRSDLPRDESYGVWGGLLRCDCAIDLGWHTAEVMIVAANPK